MCRRPGPTERHGQDRLATALRSYLAAFDSDDLEVKRAAMIAGNCEIVYREVRPKGDPEKVRVHDFVIPAL
jgi:hypothetical protein